MTIVMTFTVIYLLIVVINPVTTFFHELGHAIPMLLFNRQGKVDMFIGSFNDVEKSVQFKMGRLHLYIRLTPLLLMKPAGLCRGSQAESSYRQQLVILFGGAVFSLLLAVVSLSLILVYNDHRALSLIGFTVLAFAVIDLLMNLVPRSMKDKNGRQRFYNDGYMILFTIRTRHFHPHLHAAHRHYSEENYRDAASELNYIVQQGFSNEIVLRALCSALLLDKQHEEAARCLDHLRKISSFDATDHFHAGCLASRNNDGEQAVKHYRQALAVDPENAAVLNNLGYELAENGDYAEASVYLEKAIDLAPQLALAYDNRGYTHLMQNELEEGRRMIAHSLELDPSNAYAYRNLGLYYLKTLHYGAAIAFLNKAIRLDPNTPRAKSYLEDAWMQAAARQYLQ